MLLFTVFGYPLQNQILQSYGVLAVLVLTELPLPELLLLFRINDAKPPPGAQHPNTKSCIIYNEIQQTAHRCT